MEQTSTQPDVPSSDTQPCHGPKAQLLAECQAVCAADRSDRHAFYTSTQWTADGTCLITTSSDLTVDTFLLPADLLEAADPSRTVAPQASFRLPEPSQAVVGAPYFALSEPGSQTLLTACREHPLHLYHALEGSGKDGHAEPLAVYKLIKHETEAYIASTSLLWPQPGTHFICGSMNRIDYFDIHRYGSDGPLVTVPTVPSKKHMSRGYGIGMKGDVSALASTQADANGSSILAAGTRTRWLGMYDIHRTDKAIANWAIAGTGGLDAAHDTGGKGVVQVCWSPCERYLLVNERHADGLLVYDIRGTGKLLSILRGRPTSTQQRLTCDIFPGENGSYEVWAGTEDGQVIMWDRAGESQGDVDPGWSFQAHEAPVGSAALHSCGSVLATCSGGWSYPDSKEDENPGRKVLDESSLRIWQLMAGNTA